MADIFVSYASADREKAQAIGKLLASRGHSVWWDRSIPPGEIFDEVIQRSLDTAKCVVVLWSAASVVSNWVKTEAAEAAGRNILVPALIEDVRLPIEFKRIQSANLVEWDSDLRHPEFQNLLAAIERVVAAPRLEAPAPSAVRSGGADDALTAKSRRRPYVGYALVLGLVLAAATAYWLYPKPAVPNSDTKLITKEAQMPAKRLDEPAPRRSGSAGTPQASVNTTNIASLSGKRVNLLAKENGGQLVAAPDTIWTKSIKDYDDLQGWAGSGEGVFAFKDEGPATFDTFAILIPKTHEANLNEFELLTGNESPTGHFESIGQFATQNVRLMNSPYQEFKFPPVKAKYLKVKLLTNHLGRKGSAVLHKFQLMGTLD
jgi:hypothetical protein